MATPAPFELPASSFWRGLSWLLSGSSLLVLGLWWAAPSTDEAFVSRPLMGVLALLCCAAPGWRLFSPPCTLRLRASGWEWAPGDSGQWEAGSLVVALDLGFSMLLRFDATGPGKGRRRVWLAVDRRATASTWHALRCAVYSSPTSSTLDPPAERRHPSRPP